MIQTDRYHPLVAEREWVIVFGRTVIDTLSGGRPTGTMENLDRAYPYDPDASRVVASEASFVELYDYQNDPGETENLAYTQACSACCTYFGITGTTT